MGATLAVQESGIYELRCLGNGKSYIGSASNLTSRRRDHFHNLQRGVHCNRHLQNAWNKYGEELFVFAILKICSIKQLIKWEQIFIDEFGVFEEGFNLCPKAGSRLGSFFSEKTKKEMSRTRKGRILSEETKRKISKSNKGRICSEETRKKIGKASKRHQHSEETKRRMSESAKRRPPCTEEMRRKISEIRRGRPSGMLGKHHTKEAKRKIGEAQKGSIHPHSEETKKKISKTKRRNNMKEYK